MSYLWLLAPVAVGIAVAGSVAAADVAGSAAAELIRGVQEGLCRVSLAEEILRKEAEKAAKKAARKAAKEAMSSSESDDSDERVDNHGRRRVILMKN